MNPSSARSRPYAGIDPEQRRARRRQALLAAGLQRFGNEGYAETSIRDVCAAAGLNRRYFYESFASREALLRAVYDGIVESLTADILASIEPGRDFHEKIVAGLRAFWDHITSDPCRARVLTIEIVGVSDSLEQHGREARHHFAELIAGQAIALAGDRDLAPLVDVTIVSRALVAATIDLVVDWMRGDTGLSAAQLAEQSSALFMACARAVFGGAGLSPLAYPRT